MMTLVFVRHGHPNYKLNCLTDVGKEQAIAAKDYLKTFPIDTIYSSPAGRAKETAEPLAYELGKEIYVIPEFDEIAWGVPGEMFQEKYHPWKHARLLTKSGNNLLHFDENQDEIYKGTALESSRYRVEKAIDDFLLNQGYKRENDHYVCIRENNEMNAIFSHGGFSACAFAHLLNQPLFYSFYNNITYFTSVTVIEFRGEVGDIVFPRVRFLNDYHHTEGMEPRT